MESTREIIGRRYGKDASRWYCEACSKGHKYLGEIGGTQQICEGCGSMEMTTKCSWLESGK